MANLSTFTAVPFIVERSEATPGLWNNIFSVISQNLDQLNSQAEGISSTGVSTNTLAPTSGNTITVNAVLSTNTWAPQSGNTITILAAVSTNTLVPQSGNTLIVAYPSSFVARSYDSGGAVFHVNAFGAVGNNSGNDAIGINGAIAAAKAVGGGIIQFSALSYLITSTITVSTPQIVLQGEGGAFTTDVGSLNSGTQIIWGGATNGTPVVFSPIPGAASQALKRVGMRDILVRGNNSAGTGVLIKSVQGGIFQRLYIDSCRSVCLDLSSCTSLGEVRDNQQSIYDSISMRQIDQAPSWSGVCMQLDGDGTAATDVSNNDFINISSVHSGGVAYQMNNCDSNRFWSIKAFNAGRNSAGTGFVLSAGTADILSCRANLFGWVSSGSGGFSAQSANGIGTRDNAILYYSTANGEPQPVVTSGATLSYNLSSGLVRVASTITSGSTSIAATPLELRGTGAAPLVFFRTDSAPGASRNWGIRLNADQSGDFVFQVSTTNVGGPATDIWGFTNNAMYPSAAGGVQFGTTALPWGGSQFSGVMVVTNGQINIPVGTATLPTLAFSSESSLGWYRSAASVMALSYGGLAFKSQGAAGANASCGTVVLGSNGSANVANTYVAAGDIIFLTDMTPGGTIGSLEILGIRAGSGFTVASTNVADTSTVGWMIVRPLGA